MEFVAAACTDMAMTHGFHDMSMDFRNSILAELLRSRGWLDLPTFGTKMTAFILPFVVSIRIFKFPPWWRETEMNDYWGLPYFHN